MKPAKLPCPVPGCRGRRHSVFMLMCAGCWGLVPKATQTQVHRAWARRRREPGNQAAAREHEDATAAAIAAVVKARQPGEDTR